MCLASGVESPGHDRKQMIVKGALKNQHREAEDGSERRKKQQTKRGLHATTGWN